MNHHFASLLLLATAAASCSTSSGSHTSTTPDASADVTVDMAAPPVDGAPPDDARLPPDVLESDASPMCQNMMAEVESLQPAAQACTLGGGHECQGEVMGICCPVTIDSNADPDNVEAFTAAAANYVQSCHIMCNPISCPKDVPSGSCVAGAGGGVCM